MPLAGLLAKQPPHALEHTVFLRVVRVVFAGDLEDGGEGIGECVDAVPDSFCDL